jgi:hypothetical protein
VVLDEQLFPVGNLTWCIGVARDVIDNLDYYAEVALGCM